MMPIEPSPMRVGLGPGAGHVRGADPGKGDGLLGIGDGHVVERLLDARRAVIHRMVVGEREQIEAGIDQRLDRGGMAPEVEGAFALVAVGRDVVAVGDHGLEIDEGKIAVHFTRDARERVAKRRDLLALAEAAFIDRRFRRIEAGIAGEHDGEAIELLAFRCGGARARARACGADRGGELGGRARRCLAGAVQRARACAQSGKQARDRKRRAPASCHPTGPYVMAAASARGRGSSSKPRLWSRARWIIARSASALIVSSGLTPIERGMAAPSQT